MAYKKYKYPLGIRLLLIALCILLLVYTYGRQNQYYFTGAVILTLVIFINLYQFINKRFSEVDDFLESVKYRDFSRWFNERTGAKDMQELHKSFNTAIRTIKAINSEMEIQHFYLKRILEMVNTGIIAYHTTSGKVLVVNDAFQEILDVPAFKNVSFIEKRKQEFFEEVFKKHNPETIAIAVVIGKEKANVLVSDALFKLEDQPYKIIAVQNIEETIDHTESEAWKKLLSVMTHEIMNSIAPISSLAETLQNHIQKAIENPKETPIDMEDLEMGIESIRKRSEGLMMFAKTYRSLHKITQLNPSTVRVSNLFENIKNLMLPSLKEKEVKLNFILKDVALKVNIDVYLVEQTLINLILNAIDATEQQTQAVVNVSAFENLKGQIVLQVADNGNGIPEEILDKIFVPFFTTKKKGSGVGLSLAKQIMLLHKGKIQVDSSENTGTKINLIFQPL
ncbi:sensor histidine kinase [Zhouia sp. PK063]|uniref:sensor histidine kinase n=1 Tax=Zhouia sp. PK063 TaxID=3373602 RepID=UPI0037924AA3